MRGLNKMYVCLGVGWGELTIYNIIFALISYFQEGKHFAPGSRRGAIASSVVAFYFLVNCIEPFSAPKVGGDPPDSQEWSPIR